MKVKELILFLGQFNANDKVLFYVKRADDSIYLEDCQIEEAQFNKVIVYPC